MVYVLLFSLGRCIVLLGSREVCVWWWCVCVCGGGGGGGGLEREAWRGGVLTVL